jgi:peptide/nickel transport system ATP-binding protein
MRQRVMIAMAIINEPRLIIADEPTTALDVTVQAQILELLRRIISASGAAIMLITHDLGVVAGMADRVQVMYGGTIVETAPAAELFARPRMPYTVGLLGSVPHPELVGQRLTPIPGAPPSPLRAPVGCAFAPRCALMVEDPCLRTEPDLARVGEARERHLARCHRSGELAAQVPGAQLPGGELSGGELSGGEPERREEAPRRQKPARRGRPARRGGRGKSALGTDLVEER